MQVMLEQSQLAMILELTRSRAGLSQEYMAKKCGCSQAFLSQIERGDREPSLKVLRVYAKETAQAPLISFAGGAYIGYEESQLVNEVSQSVRAKMAISLMQST